MKTTTSINLDRGALLIPSASTFARWEYGRTSSDGSNCHQSMNGQENFFRAVGIGESLVNKWRGGKCCHTDSNGLATGMPMPNLSRW
eukprot:scaffold127712_cov43-Prasinocladus_malaysianus.AAC.1